MNMAIGKDAFAIYEELKAIAIEKSTVDEKVLKRLLNTMLYELKQTKRCDLLDALYTSCLHYAFLPRQNKRTYPEIRIKPVGMGVSGTDAMLLIQLLDMRAESENCFGTDEFKALSGKLFTTYVMKPGKVNRNLGKTFRHMNTILCQHGALAHFGSEEQKEMYTMKSDGGNIGLEKQADDILAEAKTEDEASARIAVLIESAKAKCSELIENAEKEADGIVENARKRERLMADASNGAIEKELAALLSAVTESNKAAVAMQASVTEAYPNRFAKDLIELYDLITDTMNASADETAKKNLASFVGMIEDILVKYGVEAVKTKSGAAFDGKLHEANTEDFNPKNAVVEKSIRTGFATKTLVIRKEIVGIRD